jgi:hypothetical protein
MMSDSSVKATLVLKEAEPISAFQFNLNACPIGLNLSALLGADSENKKGNKINKSKRIIVFKIWSRQI